MQDEKLVDLNKVKLKCIPEDGIDEDEQAGFFDWEYECIKCHWGSSFKGSIEARVIKQHLKSSKMHLMERRRHLHPNEPDPMEGVTEIRMLL